MNCPWASEVQPVLRKVSKLPCLSSIASDSEQAARLRQSRVLPFLRHRRRVARGSWLSDRLLLYSNVTIRYNQRSSYQPYSHCAI